MDAVTLIDRARDEGVRLSVVDGQLEVEAPESKRDWIARLRSHKQQIVAVLNGDPAVPPVSDEDLPKVRPLPDESPVAPYSFNMLPDPLREFVDDVAERMQCPPDFPAVALIAVIGSVIGRRCGIRPRRRDDWTVVPNLWGAVVGRRLC